MSFQTSHIAALIVLAGVSAVAPAVQGGEEIRYGTRQTAAEVEDIGVIGEAESKSPVAPPPSKLHFNASIRSEFTSNAKLSGSRSSSDVIFFPAVEASYSTALGHGFGFDAVAQVETGVYSSHDDRSFIGYSGQTTLSWRPEPKMPRLFIGADPYRYDSYDRGGLITEAIGTVAGVDWGMSLNSGKTYIFTGYTFENDFSDPAIDNRAEHRAIVGLTQQLRPQLFAQFFYQYIYTQYHDVERDDNRNVLSLSLIWQINRHLFGTLSGGFVDNNSTQPAASYKLGTTALGLSYQF